MVVYAGHLGIAGVSHASLDPVGREGIRGQRAGKGRERGRETGKGKGKGPRGKERGDALSETLYLELGDGSWRDGSKLRFG